MTRDPRPVRAARSPKLSRKGNLLTIDWDGVAEASRYVVTVRRGDGAVRSYTLTQRPPAGGAAAAGDGLSKVVPAQSSHERRTAGPIT